MKTNLPSTFIITLLLPILSSHLVESLTSKSLRSKNIQPQHITTSPADYEGSWRLVEATSDDGMVSLPSSDDVILNIKQAIGDSSYNLAVKASNSFRSSFDIVGQDEDGFDNIDMGLVMTTLMAPPSDFMDIETFLSTNLSDLNKIKYSETNTGDYTETLIMTGDDNITLLCEKIPDPMVYEGRWKVVEANINDESVDMPIYDDITLEFIKNEEISSEYTLIVKAINIFRTNVDIAGRDSDGYDNIELGPVASTRKAVPENYIDIESFFTNQLSNMNKMKSYTVEDEETDEENMTLTMKGDNVELVCVWFPTPPTVLDYEGKWKLIEAYDNDESVTIPANDDIILEFVGNPGPFSFQLFAKADNMFRTNMDIISTVSYDDDDDKNRGFDEIVVGPVASTKKIPLEKFRDVEEFFSKALSTMNEMKLVNNNNKDDGNIKLIMKSDSSKMVCEKYVPSP